MPTLDALREAIREAHLAPEGAVLDALRPHAPDAGMRERAGARAVGLVRAIRGRGRPGLMEAFLAEYGLSTEEGVALMCLAEALLRVPDAATMDALIEDKIAPSEWGAHLGRSSSPLVNASTWGLMLTGRVLREGEGVAGVLRGAVRRLGEPVIRTAAQRAMREMGAQFVLGQTIEEALRRGHEAERRGYGFSYDMLGEAAMTARDAGAYLMAYEDAIARLTEACRSQDVRENPGISIKLSALHPRYEEAQRPRVMDELVPRVLSLAKAAREAGMGLNVDAEEADRLDLSLDVIEAVLCDPALAGWDGFGVVVQAYGRRAGPVIDWLHALAEAHGRRIMVRLVKGAYWDGEIKRAQVEGLPDFPVFSTKAATDVSFLACAGKLLSLTDRIYPQIATHNAHSVASVLEIARARGVEPGAFELQRLHGMGEALHDIVLARGGVRSRIYAPVGRHRDLLAYLVRRLLENGANSSFVSRLVDEQVPPEVVVADPFEAQGAARPNRAVTPPPDLFAPERRNSAGFDLADPATLACLQAARASFRDHRWSAGPLIAVAAGEAGGVPGSGEAAGMGGAQSTGEMRGADGAAGTGEGHGADVRSGVGGALDADGVSGFGNPSCDGAASGSGDAPATGGPSGAHGASGTDAGHGADGASDAGAAREAGRALGTAGRSGAGGEAHAAREALDAGVTPDADGARAVRNPADHRDVVGEVRFAAPAEVEAALAAARPWDAAPEERARVLRRASDLMEERHGEVFALLAREAGKTLPDAVSELREAVDFLRYYAARGPEQERPARGVVACVSPWNFPLAIFTGQVAAALAAGCGVLAKPAEATGLVAHLAVTVLHEAGVPRRALQLLPGEGGTVGRALSSDPRVDGVVFTGSTATAQAINRAMAEGLDPRAPLIAETGGINAMIVDSSALPEQAVRDAVASAFRSAGQRCSALRVLYVQRDVAAGVLAMLEGAMDELSLGDPWELSADIGPAIDEAARSRIEAHVERARSEGRLRHRLEAHGGGSFVAPALIEVGGIEDLAEEVFGPVLHVATFAASEIDAVIDAVNASGYGLTFGMHSRIDDRVERIASRLTVGNVYVNRDQIGAVVGSQPFGGEGLSGTGPKAGGPRYVPRFTRPEPVPAAAARPGPAADPVEVERRLHAARGGARLRTTTQPGPTGESNRLTVLGRGVVLCLGPDAASAAEQARIARENGCGAVEVAPGASGPSAVDGVLPRAALETLHGFDAVALWSDEADLRAARRALAARPGPLIPLLAEGDLAERCRIERHLCVDTTASGGNATLLAQAG